MIDIESPVTLMHGKVEDALPLLPDQCVDAIVTDPPYALDMGGGTSDWDRYSAEDFERWCEGWARECLRVAKPGAWLLSAGSARTVHRLTSGIEDAGWKIVDGIEWIYASSFHRAIDVPARLLRVGLPDRIAELEGRSTFLKSRHEPFVLARAPMPEGLTQTIAEYGTATLDVTSTDTNGTGACNVIYSHEPECVENGPCIGGCPVDALGIHEHYFPAVYWASKPLKAERPRIEVEIGKGTGKLSTIGEFRRWRCRVSGQVTHSYMKAAGTHSSVPHPVCNHAGECDWEPLHTNTFVSEISHNTVKPLSLMRWMIRLSCHPNGTVLDMFAGSGTTLEAAVLERRRVIGIEKNWSSVELTRSRLRRSRCSLEGSTTYNEAEVSNSDDTGVSQEAKD